MLPGPCEFPLSRSVIICITVGHVIKELIRVGVTKPISSIPLFSEFFNIVKTRVSYWISRLYLTGVTTAELRWHLSNINVIKKSKRYFCNIENVAYAEINERSFSNPHPWSKKGYQSEMPSPMGVGSVN